MEISRYLEVDIKDEENQIMIIIKSDHGMEWINKEQAVELINHLKEQFKID